MARKAAFAILLLAGAFNAHAQATRFCLEGEFDLGTRYQGTDPSSPEWYPTRWCVTTEDDSERVLFSARGHSNPDMESNWTVAYLPPATVRIVNRASPPDIEFDGVNNPEEARSVRRLDPHRLLSEYFTHPGSFANIEIKHRDGRLLSVNTRAELPLRGEVNVSWNWDWTDTLAPRAELRIDGEPVFRGIGQWQDLDQTESSESWTRTPGADPIEVPGEHWPSRVAMQLVELSDRLYLVRGVRTGFQHLVVDTSEGLVIGDAPAGWLELHSIPPTELVPGLAISGLSEQFVDYLKQQLPGRPIAAVAITHAHDDHAGGARAFAAEGAKVYAPEAVEAFLEKALNRPEMPQDRLARARSSIDIIPVRDPITIGEGSHRAQLVPLGSGPHSSAMLGLWAPAQDYFFVSDVHVPNSDAESPRAERALTECWFAGVAVKKLPQTTQVVNSHSAVITPVSRLSHYLSSDFCR